MLCSAFVMVGSSGEFVFISYEIEFETEEDSIIIVHVLEKVWQQ